MLQAALYGVLASSGLLIGAVIGLLVEPPRRIVAGIMAFGCGVLVSALTFELTAEAFETGAESYVVGGFLSGAVIYVVTASILNRMAARSPKREGRLARDVRPDAARQPETKRAAAISGTALLIGAILDGIPENAAIGISLHAEGQKLGAVLLAAVFMANLPESISSSVGMRQEGRSRRYVMGVWTVAAAVTSGAAVAGYSLLGGLSANMVGAILALAAGGILAMLADTMMPEAFENGGPFVALATAVGFVAAVLLSRLGA
ncbi:MAG: ZIP family zinc transporter [Chloroflexi bacterium]|nr:ZIP family zinc transporter [Chloroflexota bacterium]